MTARIWAPSEKDPAGQMVESNSADTGAAAIHHQLIDTLATCNDEILERYMAEEPIE
ncbi:hypothetical protein MASR1M12_22330 [Erysipelotrichia bacterium]